MALNGWYELSESRRLEDAARGVVHRGTLGGGSGGAILEEFPAVCAGVTAIVAVTILAWPVTLLAGAGFSVALAKEIYDERHPKPPKAVAPPVIAAAIPAPDPYYSPERVEARAYMAELRKSKGWD